MREDANKQHCKKNDAGQYLCCKCGGALCEDETILCNACSAANEARLQRERAERRESERVLGIRYTAERGLEGVPQWPHARVDSPEFDTKCRSRQIRKFARLYTRERGDGVLSGPSGLGKTTGLVAVAYRQVDEGIKAGIASRFDLDESSVRFSRGQAHLEDKRPPALVFASAMVWVTAREIVMARRSHELGSEPELLTKCIGASLLFLDEIGSEPHDRDGDLFGVIDARYAAGRPTLATTGLPLKDFEERYGSALLRRLTERGTKIEEFGGG
ncbi:MAG: hypothetical protein ACOY0T_09550 [Myxococcota bacterium]